MWDKRLRANVRLDDRQKGFVPVDGCFKNVKTLQNIIKQQRKRKCEYNIVFLDLAKAFDLVLHWSIRNRLKRKGILTTVIEGIVDMYNGSTTKISVGGRTTRRKARMSTLSIIIQVNNG